MEAETVDSVAPAASVNGLSRINRMKFVVGVGQIFTQLLSVGLRWFIKTPNKQKNLGSTDPQDLYSINQLNVVVCYCYIRSGCFLMFCPEPKSSDGCAIPSTYCYLQYAMMRLKFNNYLAVSCIQLFDAKLVLRG